MFMCKQVVLAIFIIPVAFRAETELQAGIIQLGPAAHGAPVLCPVGIMHMRRGLTFEFCLARSFFRRKSPHISRRQEEDHKV